MWYDILKRVRFIQKLQYEIVIENPLELCLYQLPFLVFMIIKTFAFMIVCIHVCVCVCIWECVYECTKDVLILTLNLCNMSDTYKVLIVEGSSAFWLRYGWGSDEKWWCGVWNSVSFTKRKCFLLIACHLAYIFGQWYQCCVKCFWSWTFGVHKILICPWNMSYMWVSPWTSQTLHTWPVFIHDAIVYRNLFWKRSKGQLMDFDRNCCYLQHF